MVALNRNPDIADASSSGGRLRDDWFSIACLTLIPVSMMAGAILGTYVGVIFASTILAGLLG